MDVPRRKTNLLGAPDRRRVGWGRCKIGTVSKWINKTLAPLPQQQRETIMLLNRVGIEKAKRYYSKDWKMCKYIGDDRSTSRSSIATQQPIVEVPISLRNKVIQNLLVERSQPSADKDEQMIVENACRQLRPDILDRVTLNKQARLLDSLLDEKRRYLPISVGKSPEERKTFQKCL